MLIPGQQVLCMRKKQSNNHLYFALRFMNSVLSKSALLCMFELSASFLVNVHTQSQWQLYVVIESSVRRVSRRENMYTFKSSRLACHLRTTKVHSAESSVAIRQSIHGACNLNIYKYYLTFRKIRVNDLVH